MAEAESPQSSMEALQARVRQLEEREAHMQQATQQMEEDFGQRRAKLKELYLQKEEELRIRAEQVEGMESELQVLRDQCRQLQHELDEAKSAVTIAECTAENQVAVEKRKCNEEIATLQQILKEEVASAVEKSSSHYEVEIKRLKKAREQLEAEKQHYRRLYEKKVELDSELRSRGDSLLSPNVLSAVTKSLAKRVPSLSPSAGGTPEKTVPPTCGSSAPGSSEQENLEDSMKKVNSRYAQEDAELLRSLVVPLEEEIFALKEKLREQDAQLRAHEAQQQAAIESSDIMGQLLQGKPTSEVLQELDEKLKGVSSNLEVEKSTRADLEMYVAIQNAKNTALQNEYDRLRSQMTELKLILEQEKRQHTELKHTWQRANDQFLESQRLHIVDLRRMQSVLTHEQLRRLEELQREDEGSLSSSIHASPLSSLPESVPWVDKPSSSSLSAKSPQSKKKSIVENQDSEGELQQSKGQEGGDETGFLLLDLEEREGGGDDSSSLTEGEEFLGSSLASRFSPDKIPHLTEDQQKALIGDGESSVLVSDSAKEDETLEDGRRLVSEKEWVMLQQEVRQARNSVSRTCHMCANYETQLQKVQSEYREVEKQHDVLEKAIARYQEDLNREGLYRRQMEDKWKELSSEYEKKVTEVYRQVETTHARQNELVTRYRSAVTQLQEQLRHLTHHRELVQKELTRLQKENDSLMGKHSKHSQEMQNEIINLPNNMEDMQLMLLRCHEDIIAAKVAKEHVESTLKSEILFLKDRILAEQHEKETIEDRLSAEVDQLREKVAILESVESQVESEQKLRADSDSKAKELKSKLNESQMKSQQIISGLKTQASENIQAKTRLESEVLELKGRIASLQQELDTSEAVQRDFVRLSQSLQVELEKIRQSQTEVRWQHEEDVDECNNCKVRFSVGRRKNYCKHCGKIFCAECVNKTVPSGPNKRPSKVCDVCHTLLVQDATPYFSTEPPHSPE
ncbi:rab GTPase-binding effector protein 1-like isoform X3 [Oratosquilla oratoria]|uniref:rab GTPase-binding effector protein 1-like isoform X3 n=1 Tax=Oratosquilla oratoria TaxID=337810 RepID=UPI003F772C78